jgi:hypothetical protein
MDHAALVRLSESRAEILNISKRDLVDIVAGIAARDAQIAALTEPSDLPADPGAVLAVEEIRVAASVVLGDITSLSERFERARAMQKRTGSVDAVVEGAVARVRNSVGRLVDHVDRLSQHLDRQHEGSLSG